MNLKDDYTSFDIGLNPDYEGETKAVLTVSNKNTGKRNSVLYIHGYIDYFFHPHLGEKFNLHNYDFFALDLRKYGRALMPHQHPNYCKDLKEYFEEITLAIQQIKQDGKALILLGHSTGGLTASYYMNYGKERKRVDALILNSPFLDFYQSKFEKYLSQFAAQILSRIHNYAKVEGALPPVYAQSIHKDFYGVWDFNLKWKPIDGFPTYFAWLRAIARAQKQLKYSNIEVPILILSSANSKQMKSFSEEAMTNDIVLNVKDIARRGRTLGQDTSLVQIKNAQHDIFLSPTAVREEGFKRMFSWLKNALPEH